MACTKYGKKVYKSSFSGKNVHGRTMLVSRGKNQPKAFSTTSMRTTFKVKPHTEMSIRRKIRNPAGNKYRPAKVKEHSKYVGRKVRRRG
jgi:hypothetical protein